MSATLHPPPQPRALLFLPFTPRVGLPGPFSASSPPASAAVPSRHVCAGLCAGLGVTSLCPQSLLPLLPAPPAEAALPQGEGLTSWQEAPWSCASCILRGWGQHRGGCQGGAGPSLGAPLPASPEHLSPTSWSCPHRCPGPRGQWNSRDSLPAQRKASVHTSPEPWPKWAPWGVDTATPHCSSWHTTWAVARSRSASQTVPQVRPRLTSRRPAQECLPPASRASVCPGGGESSNSDRG